MAARARLHFVLPLVAALVVGVVLVALPGENDGGAGQPDTEPVWIKRYVDRFQEAQRLFGRGDDVEAERIYLKLAEEQVSVRAAEVCLLPLLPSYPRSLEGLFRLESPWLRLLSIS